MTFSPRDVGERTVTLRPFPHPFRAMLSINSDIDRTSPLRFREIHRFLNTKEETPLGPGLGLDISDSMWFYRPRLGRLDPVSTELSYFHGTDWTVVSPFAEEVLHYVRCGWIDTIHGYGNFSQATDPDQRFTRRHAEEALGVLAREGLTIPVWSNHGAAGNIQNIGLRPWMEGDDPDSPAYHADLLRPAGVVYHWGIGRATEAGAPTKLKARELHDGEPCWEFTRFSSRSFEDAERDGLPEWQVEAEAGRQRKTPILWLPRWLHVQLAESVLSGLVEGGHFSVVAQHLGTARPMIVLGGPAAEALRRLASWQESGDILVARTSRQLAYNRARDNLRFSADVGDDGALTIDVTTVDDPVLGSSVPTIDDLRGITFVVEEAARARLLVAGQELEQRLVRRTSDEAGETIGIVWHEPDYEDYGAAFAQGLRVLPSAKEKRRLDREGVAALQAVTDSLDGETSTGTGAAVSRGYRHSLSERVVALRSLGFVDFEAVHLGCGAGEWCLAMAKSGVQAVTGIDPRPAFLSAARVAAESAAVGGQTSFLLSGVSGLELPPESCEFVYWHSSPGFTNVEAVLDVAARALRQSGAAYVTYTAPGGFIRSIERSLGGESDAWRASARKLMAERLYRHGLVSGPGSRQAPDLSELLAIADSRGLAIVDQPRLSGQPESHLGLPVEVEVLFRREREPDSLREQLVETELGDALHERLARLLEAGAPQLVADVIASRASGERDPGLRRLQLAALLRAGAASDPIVDELARELDDPLLHGLVHHARGEASAALRHYAATEPEPTFLIGSAHLLAGDLAAGEAAFSAAPATTDGRIDSAVGLLDLAARRNDRQTAGSHLAAIAMALADQAVAGAAGSVDHDGQRVAD